MAKNAGSSGAVISLSQGGGAVNWIGEKFSPDLHTGTGDFSVPIALPRGSNGFQPQLSLVYSTGNRNGPFGLGWNLSVPGISRKTSKRGRLYDSKDTLVISGAEDLVPVGSNGNWTRYRRRTEGLFARIRHYLDADTDYWKAESKDGLVSLYGTPGARGKDPAVITNPANTSEALAGLMQVNVQIPDGVEPGGYVPVVLQVGDRASSPAVRIAVSGN